MKQHYKPGPEDRRLISLNARRMVMSLMCLMFVVYAFITLSVAWFSQASFVDANARGIHAADFSTKDFLLYKWSSSESGWTLIENLQIGDMVPNQTDRYMITSTSQFSGLEISVTSIVTNNNEATSGDIYDYLYIKSIADYEDVKNENFGAVSLDLLNFGNIQDSNKISTLLTGNNFEVESGSGSCQTMIFDIYISKNVCNYYSLWQIYSKLSIH